MHIKSRPREGISLAAESERYFMRHFYEKTVKHSKLILTIFAVLFVICLGCRQFVAVNYDMNDYLPPESSSTLSMELMEAEFDGGIPNARVMLRDVTVPQALAYKEQLKAIDGVTEVLWLDDVLDITEPLEAGDKDTVENYYKNQSALFTVTIEEAKRTSAVAKMRELIEDGNAMTGSAVSTAIATESTVNEINRIKVIAVAFVFFVLLITTTSWAEPFLVLCGLGVAIVINAGSNLIFGEISFVTNAAGNILQLAVSLDYSVFLLHRFEERHKQQKDAKLAMVDALCGSTTSILSSGLTTVIGFLALCLMQFQIGPDLGMALAKGIAISLLTVFFFSPALILGTYRLIDKTKHRPLLPPFHKFGKVVARLTIPMAAVFALAIVPSYLASVGNDYYYGSSHIFGLETQLGRDTADIESVYGKKDTYVLIVPRGQTAVETELCAALKEIPQVSSVISYADKVGAEIPTEYLDQETLAKLMSDNYSRMVLSVNVPYEGAETFALIENVRAAANEYYPDHYYLAGEGVSTYDLMDTVTNDMVKVNLIAIGAVFLVLLIAMKSISIPVILVLGIETAVWLNMSVPYFGGQTIFYIAYLIISSVQLGATVDYAILFTDRYKEFRQEMGKRQAVIETVSVTTVSILTSGSALTVVGFLLGKFSTHGLLSQLGYFLGKGTLFSLLIVFLVLPGLLMLFDKLIQYTTLGIHFRKEG